MQPEILEKRMAGACAIAAVLGDLTLEQVDAIVNAANVELAHGGGLAGAIVRRGGAVIQEESDRIAPVPVGGAVVTGAGDLSCRWVIHAVGPRWGEGQEEQKLRAAVQSSLSEADRLVARSIALPAIATGIFGYPKDAGTRVIVDTVLAQIGHHPDTSVRSIRLTASDRPTAELFAAALRTAG